MPAPAPPPPLPTNLSSQTRVLYRLQPETIENVAVERSLLEVPLEQAHAMRQFYSWKGKRNLEGHWFVETTQSHVQFESRLESRFLVWADWEPDVIGVSSQPLAILWPRGGSRKSHVPDYFIREANGAGTVIDVRPLDRVEKDRDQFEATRDLCREVGWGYRVWTGLDRFEMDGIAFVSGYRFARCAPSPEVREALLEVYGSPIPLEEGLRWVGHRAGVEQNVVLTGLYHLVWAHELAMDMSAPLSLRTLVGRSQR